MSEEAKKEILEWIKSIFYAVVIAIIIKTFIFNTTYVIGDSMYPTLHEGDRLFTNKLVYIIGEPKRGDIVILKAPDKPNVDYIKRVVAVENDEIKISDGKVYVNGKMLDEYYLEGSPYTHGDIDLKVPKGYVFVLGDNRKFGASKDSRYFGPVPVKSIKGKAVFRYYPFDDRFGSLYK
ncbi:signal peptidase I [Caloranaerobacter sp. DY30410]|uniref:signal peptidase I n=1 Tax=Caloranaerobacter sp. DY30410 TaxID=3238305 RepID=UPI003D036C27